MFECDHCGKTFHGKRIECRGCGYGFCEECFQEFDAAKPCPECGKLQAEIIREHLDD